MAAPSANVGFTFELMGKKKERRRKEFADIATTRLLEMGINDPATINQMGEEYERSGRLVFPEGVDETRQDTGVASYDPVSKVSVLPETTVRVKPTELGQPLAAFDQRTGTVRVLDDAPRGAKLVTTTPDESNISVPLYRKNKRTGQITDLQGNVLNASSVPKNARIEDFDPDADKEKNFYFIDSATRQMFDANMNPIDEAPAGAMPRVIGNPMAGPEISKRDSLVDGAMSSVTEARTLLTPNVLQEIKGIKFTPGKIYSQLASSDAKRFYRNLYNAVQNLLYIKTGAAATPAEIEGFMVMYMPAANDDVQDMEDRFSMLERDAGTFRSGGRRPKPGGGKETPEQRKARLLKELSEAK